MGILKKLKNFYGNFLNYLIESNRKNLGNKKMDCCDLNRRKPNQKVSDAEN